MITTNRWARFEFRDWSINSHKFWEVKETKQGFEVSYGRIGCENPCFGGILTEKQIRAKVSEKLRKGYLHVSGPIC